MTRQSKASLLTSWLTCLVSIPTDLIFSAATSHNGFHGCEADQCISSYIGTLNQLICTGPGKDSEDPSQDEKALKEGIRGVVHLASTAIASHGTVNAEAAGAIVAVACAIAERSPELAVGHEEEVCTSNGFLNFCLG